MSLVNTGYNGGGLGTVYAPNGYTPATTAKPQQSPPGTQQKNTNVGSPGVQNNDPIPNASVYLDAQNQAELAYEQAQAQLLKQRNALYHSYGLLDNGSVDPNNPYGQYQQMLGAEGAALDADRSDAVGRGLGGGPGLANQASAQTKYQNAVQNAAFQNQVNSAEANYENGLQQALQARNAAMLEAERQAALDAILNGLFNPPGTAGGDGGNGDDNAGGNGANAPGGGNTKFVNTAGGVVPYGTHTISAKDLAKIVASATKNHEPISEHGAGQAIVLPAPKKSSKKRSNAYNDNPNKRG